MRPALALIVLGIPAFLITRTSLFDPARARVEGLFERADAVLRAQAEGELYELPPSERAFAQYLPIGHWKLLVEAHPDVAFDRYYRRVYDDSADGMVAFWGIHALAQLRYPLVKPLLLRLVGSADPEGRARALRTLRYYADPSLTPWLLTLLPAPSDDYDENEFSRAVLNYATWSRPPAPALVSRELKRKEDEDGQYAFTEAARLRLRVLTAADPLVEAERGLFPAEEDAAESEFDEWLPMYVAQRKLTDFAPLLRRRVAAEIAKETENGNGRLLDFARPGEPLEPSWDSFLGFRGGFLLAAYRTALRDLGVPLTDEERSWLDRHRLLRPPREYLVEAGLLPKR